MELRQLEYFLMVSELQSFTRSAERLYVSQPAVTNAIRSLEEELDIQLFDRSQRKAKLTAEGQIFYRHIKNIMQGISSTLNEINDLKIHNSGLLTIGLTPLTGIPPFIEIIKSFQEHYPNITLNFIEGNVNDLQAKLLADKLDFAFIFYNKFEQNQLLTYTPLPKQELMVCCAKKHPLHRRNSLTLADLVEEPFILSDNGCFFRQFIVKSFEAVDTMPKISFETSHIQTVKSMAANNMGISILPDTIFDTDDALASIPLEPPLYIEPAIIHKSSQHLSYAAQAFFELIQKGND